MNSEYDEDYFHGKFGSSYKDYKSLNDSVYKLTYTFLKKFLDIEKIDPKKLDILIIGCAYGFEAKSAKDIGFQRVVGIDISNDAIIHAKKYYPEIEFYEMDIGKSNFDENEFDVIMINNVIEHISDPRKTLINLHNITKKYLLVRTDNVLMIELYNSMPILVRKIIGRIRNLPVELDTDLTHISQLPKYKWIQLFRYYNFEIIDILSISIFPTFDHYILKLT